MKQKIYAVVDIETTGGMAKRDRITEIAIVLYDGREIIDRYETLIQPDRSIPYEITRITGIDDAMVADAPRFYEVAKKVVEMTDNTIFVAHNVRFDYSFIKEEFATLGYTFTRRQLCTVVLSRKAFPGLKSYSLGNLIKHFDIKVQNRHRAMDDVLATV
ncbi:MAG: 3'-5' exonuclease, partial [Saprospiraceae bacterium]